MIRRHRASHTLLGTALAGLAAGLAAPPSAAQTLPPPQNVVSLSASASREVAMDWLTVVFSTTREGPDAAGVQAQLKQALDAALAEARKAAQAAQTARAGELTVRTGGFSLHPRYAARGGITGWQGSTELVVEGRDGTAIAQLTGRIQTLSIGRVQWTLSREAREKLEGEVQAQAIANFRDRADATARSFGFAGYTLREVNVSGGEAPGMPAPMMRVQSARAGAPEEALPVEAGKTLVSVTVSGSVQLTR
jgi:predicted secreted protein